MAITQDGSHKFGLIYPTATGVDVTKGFQLESFTRSETSNRVDLNDGNGEPIGAAIIPQRRERSFTMQMGSDARVPDAGDILTVDNGSSYYILTDVTVNETQEDFARLDATGYIATNGVRPFYFHKKTAGNDYTLSDIPTTATYKDANKTSVFDTTITFDSANYIQAFAKTETTTVTYRVEVTGSDNLTITGSTVNSGVTITAKGTGFLILEVSGTATFVDAKLHYN